MGFSKKHQVVDIGLETEGKKWVIAGIAVRSPMRPIEMKPKERECGYESDESSSTTPKGKESKIPERLSCPPAPRKSRPSSTCHFNGAREFFNPPDLESVFIRHVERAN